MAFLAISGDGSGESVGRSVAIDDGNAFVAGSFATSGTVDFDPDPLGEDTFSTNDRDAFLAKYDSAGSLAWIWTGGGGPAKLDDAWGVAVDGGGNPYVVGQFDGTVDFDPGPGTVGLAASGSPGADFNHFVAKYDNDGSLLWALTSGSSSLTEAAYGVAVGDDDDAYVVGAFRGTVDFDPTGATAELVSTGSPPGSDNNYFVARYDAAGSLVWAHTTGATTGNENGSAIALDWAGNVFVVGDFTGTVIDDQAGVTTLVADNPDYTSNMFVAKYDSDGGLLWARTSDSSAGTEAAAAVAVDNDGHVFVAGWFDGTVTFDGTVLVATGADFTSNMFVAKYDINGELMWATTTGVTDNETGEYASALSVDQQDNVYVSGAFGGTVDFDPGPGVVQLVSTGESWDTNHFTAKYSPNGKLLWVTTSGSSTGSEAVDSTVLDHNGRFYATGTFIGTADFDLGPDQAIVDSGIDQSKHFLIAYDLPDGPGSPARHHARRHHPARGAQDRLVRDRYRQPERSHHHRPDADHPRDGRGREHHPPLPQRSVQGRGAGRHGGGGRRRQLVGRRHPHDAAVRHLRLLGAGGGPGRQRLPPVGRLPHHDRAGARMGRLRRARQHHLRPQLQQRLGRGRILRGFSIRGGAGDDTIFGREEGDRLFGDNGADRINGNKGDDELHGDDGNDVVFGGQGNDWVYGDFGDDWLNGNVGNDVVQGAAGNDTLYGGRGMDQLHGGAGNDLLSGDRGNDTMTGGVGADQFYFGAESGRDRIEDFDPAADRIAVDLDVGGAINGVAIASFEQLLARIVDTPEGAFLDLGGGHGVLLAGINKAQLTIDQFLLV